MDTIIVTLRSLVCWQLTQKEHTNNGMKNKTVIANRAHKGQTLIKIPTLLPVNIMKVG